VFHSSLSFGVTTYRNKSIFFWGYQQHNKTQQQFWLSQVVLATLWATLLYPAAFEAIEYISTLKLQQYNSALVGVPTIAVGKIFMKYYSLKFHLIFQDYLHII
jgi:hypothetical protein